MLKTSRYKWLQRKLQILALPALAALTLSPPAHADALRTNGVCELSDCNNVPVTPANTSSSADFSFTYVFSNSDTYQVQGTIYEGQTSSAAAFQDEIGPLNFVITYLGNNTNTASANDVLSNEFLGSYPSENAGVGYFFSDLQGVFGPGLGLASSATATFNVDGQLVSTIGPVSPPPGTFDLTQAGSNRIVRGIQTLDYDYSLTFGEGSAPGASITLYPTTTSSTPEPSSYLLLGTGLLGLARQRRRRLDPQ